MNNDCPAMGVGGAHTWDDDTEPKHCMSCGIQYPQDINLIDRLREERDEARRHARDHHLEACESCAVTESELNVLENTLRALVATLEGSHRIVYMGSACDRYQITGDTANNPVKVARTILNSLVKSEGGAREAIGCQCEGEGCSSCEGED